MNTVTDLEQFQDRPADILIPPAPYVGLTFALDGLEACITEIDEHLVYVIRVYVDNKRDLINFDTALVFSKHDFNSITLNSVLKGAVFFSNLINDIDVAYNSRFSAMQVFQLVARH